MDLLLCFYVVSYRAICSLERAAIMMSHLASRNLPLDQPDTSPRMAEPNLNSQLGTFTIPQLKKLCKDQQVAGYSKLNKGALIQKLEEHRKALGGKLNTTIASNNASSPTIPPVALPLKQPETPSTVLIALAPPQASAIPTAPQPIQVNTFNGPSVSPFPQPHVPTSLVATGVSTVQRAGIVKHSPTNLKRKALELVDLRPMKASKGLLPVASAKPKTSPPGKKNAHNPVEAIDTPPVDLPNKQRISFHHAGPTFQVSEAPGSTRKFVPLQPERTIQRIERLRQTAFSPLGHGPYVPAFSVEPRKQKISLPMIAIPPKLNQRPRVVAYAIILQHLSNDARAACARSNRLVRYAGTSYALSCTIVLI